MKLPDIAIMLFAVLFLVAWAAAVYATIHFIIKYW